MNFLIIFFSIFISNGLLLLGVYFLVKLKGKKSPTENAGQFLRKIDTFQLFHWEDSEGKHTQECVRIQDVMYSLKEKRFFYVFEDEEGDIDYAEVECFSSPQPPSQNGE